MRSALAGMAVSLLVAGLFGLGGYAQRWGEVRDGAHGATAVAGAVRQEMRLLGALVSVSASAVERGQLLGARADWSERPSAAHDVFTRTQPLPASPTTMPAPSVIEVRDQREHPATRYEVYAAAVAAFPSEHVELVQVIAWCESRGDASKVGAAGEAGVMQIHPVHRELVRRLGYSWAQMFELGPNMAVAAYIAARDGFGPWACRWASW